MEEVFWSTLPELFPAGAYSTSSLISISSKGLSLGLSASYAALNNTIFTSHQVWGHSQPHEVSCRDLR